MLRREYGVICYYSVANTRDIMIRSHQTAQSAHSAVHHEVIKTACEKWEKMCEEEDGGGRPIFRARGWKKEEKKASSWHKRDSKGLFINDVIAGGGGGGSAKR